VKDKPPNRLPRIAFSILCPLSLISLLLGCHSTPPPTPLSQLTAQQTHGHQVFQEHCSLCHYDRQDEMLHGPALIGVFKKPYLHSGAPANDTRVTTTILHGRGLMPAQSLESDDLNDLLSYLHTL
jgi:mono/diheme cytochrome c family protein